jgi:hypothetical protein
VLTCERLRFHIGRVNILARDLAAVQTALDTSYKHNRHYARRINDILLDWLGTNLDNETVLDWLPREYTCPELDTLRYRLRRSRKAQAHPPTHLSAASVIHQAKKAFHNEWNDTTKLPSYRGGSFLSLGKWGRRIPMSTRTARIYMEACRNSVALLARFTRAVTSHAPIGWYYQRFEGLGKSPLCQWCLPRRRCIQTRAHILDTCSQYSRYWESWLGYTRGCPDPYVNS